MMETPNKKKSASRRLPAFVAPADAESWLAVRKLGTELFGPHVGWRAAKGLWKRWGFVENVD